MMSRTPSDRGGSNKRPNKRTNKAHTARSWIEATFQKRECIKFVPSIKDEHRCCCGATYIAHTLSHQFSAITAANNEKLLNQEKAGSERFANGKFGGQEKPPAETWTPAKHTQASPTDAYGTIEFQGGPHPTKAQYVRMAYDTRPDLIVQLFTREWGLELPKLLITVQGGKANFELQPKLKKVLRKGLLKAAKTTGAWVFTGGTNTGVTRQVGDALLLESQRAGRVVSIGIAPWGIVENNQELVGHNRDVPYHSISSPRSKFAVLNSRHAYFLLVDNGTGGSYGAEIILRRKLEKYISKQKLHPYTHSSTPVVCLVIEGGTNTIRAVLEYVTDDPPVPVVVCDGSGRAADLLAFVHKYATESGEQTVLESMKDYLITTIQRTFEVAYDPAECLFYELLQCTKRKNLITIFRIQEGKTQELDQTILTGLFKSQHLSPSEQLSLALTWNRVDIARSEIFVYGQEWPPGALDEAMMQALEHDRIDFVKLLLENGVSMKKFLTIPRLEELYNTKQGPSNTLGYILRDVRPHIPRGYVYTLHDIGLVINKLMGGAYRAYYTRRKFRPIYAKVMNKTNSHIAHRNSASFVKYCGGGNPLSLLTGMLPVTTEMALFDYPFNELLTWAVLTKRQQMALLMWTHGEEALAKALAACKLYKAMAHEAAEDDLETEIYEELRNYGKEFENKALELLDFCYRQDDDQTQQLLTCELQNWSGQTCLSLAVAANHRALLAHPCSQIILADLWMGGLRTRKNTNLKVILGLLCPFYIVRLEFKSKEELQLMPQTEEEHLENESLLDEEQMDQDEERHADGETKGRKSIRLKCGQIGQGGQALLTEYDTRVQSDGKVDLAITNGSLLSNQQAAGNQQQQTHQSTIDSETPSSPLSLAREYVPLQLDGFFELKRHRPLRLQKKLYEFFTAPITKFWADSLAYMFFLIMFTYTVLVKMEKTPTWQEFYSIAYICTLGCEKIREIVSSEPVAISHKFAVWTYNMWNPCDAVTILVFLIGLSLRLRDSTMDIGRVLYCIDSIYWYLRILNILGVNKYLGPLVTMMGKMVKNMIYFVVLLLVVLMSFGVCRQAILQPDNEASWNLVRDVVFQPYFMLYGEVFADEIDPPCGGGDGEPDCVPGHFITPLAMSVYLLVANILLINLLIAVFNNIFNEVNAVSHQVWMFQRFTVVMEFEQKPVLPPPLIILSHIYLLLKYLRRKIKGVRETYDNGLKLFLEKDDMERLYDFEEECVEGYFREQEFKLNQSTEERVRNTTERVENIVQKVEDINQKANLQISTIQSLEFRLRKMEDTTGQIMSHLAVIHRFMAQHTTPQLLAPHGAITGQQHLHQSASDLDKLTGGGTHEIERLRRASERSDDADVVPMGQGFGHGIPTTLGLGNTRRRPVVRSLTEVRPDAYIFDDGRIEVKPLTEEDEDMLEEDATLTGDALKQRFMTSPQVTSPAPSQHHLQSSATVTPLGVSRQPSAETPTNGQAASPLTSTGRPSAALPSNQQSGPNVPSSHAPPSHQGSIQRAKLERGLSMMEGRGRFTSDEVDELGEVAEVEQDEDAVLDLNFQDGVRQRANSGRSQTHSAGGRRSSFGGHDVLSERATPYLSTCRRQLSQTHSEPDNTTDNSAHAGGFHQYSQGPTSGTGMRLIPPSSGTTPNPRHLLMAMHTEYTSITDELETYCGLLSPPRTPNLLTPPSRGGASITGSGAIVVAGDQEIESSKRKRHQSEMSNPEIALYIEKEHLRDAEENDYMLMENLIQRRYEKMDNEDDDGGLVIACGSSSTSERLLTVVDETMIGRQREETRFSRNKGIRANLRRSSAIEIRDTTQASHLQTSTPCLMAVQEDIGLEGTQQESQDTKHHLSAHSSDQRQNSAETEASTGSTVGSFSNCPSERPKARPTITVTSAQLPIGPTSSEEAAKEAVGKTAQPMSETMC